VQCHTELRASASQLYDCSSSGIAEPKGLTCAAVEDVYGLFTGRYSTVAGFRMRIKRTAGELAHSWKSEHGYDMEAATVECGKDASIGRA